MFKSKNKIINSNGEDGQTEPNKSAVYKYMTESLSKVAQQLSDLQQRHPEMIIKGVVINGGAPWFSGNKKPKYHPNFSKEYNDIEVVINEKVMKCIYFILLTLV